MVELKGALNPPPAAAIPCPNFGASGCAECVAIAARGSLAAARISPRRAPSQSGAPILEA